MEKPGNVVSFSMYKYKKFGVAAAIADVTALERRRTQPDNLNTAEMPDCPPLAHFGFHNRRRLRDEAFLG